MSIQRIMAIFEKDLKDFMKNSMVIFMPILPMILAFMYRQMGMDDEIMLFFAYVIVGTAFAVIPAGGMMMMMAEENEKKTLRGLIMSPASFLDIIVGKSLVVIFFTFISLIVSLLLLGIEPFMNLKAIIGLILLFLFFLFLGIGVGLFVKTVGMTTVYLMPIMFLFGFTPMIGFLGFDESGIVLKIFEKFPITQLMLMHENQSWIPLGVVCLWLLGAALFAYICFIRTKSDD